MALRILQFSIVSAIGYYFGPVLADGVYTTRNQSLSLNLQDPQDVTVANRDNATLRCVASSNASEVSITWYHNDKPLPENDSRWQWYPDGTLFIPRVVAGKRNNITGDYACLARDTGGAILSNPAKLRTASIDRDFIKQPTNISVVQEQSVVLECSIHSTPAAEIRFEFNKQPLPQSTRYVPLPSGSLLIVDAQLSDAGFYRCIATNSILSKDRTSSEAFLSVLPNNDSSLSSSAHEAPPALVPLDLPFNQTVRLGDDLNLYCAVNGRPKPQIKWLNNDSIVVGNETVLTIRNASLKHAGNYTCVGFSPKGRVVQKYIVDVHQKPYFNVTPASMAYPLARTARLDCHALGVPEPRIYWLKNGQFLSISGRIKKQQTGLVFSHTFASDSGVYQCVAVNVAGKAWAAAQITLISTSQKPPPPQNVHCRPFDVSSICLTWQSPSNVTLQAYTTYAFYYDTNGEECSNDYLTNETKQLANNLKPNTNYTFYVRSYSNTASEQSNKVTCQTGIVGSRNLTYDFIDDKSVKFTWNQVSYDRCGDTAPVYSISWRKIGRANHKSEKISRNTYTISDLQTGVNYQFSVKSESYSEDTLSIVTFTLPGEGNFQIGSSTSPLDDLEEVDSRELEIDESPDNFKAVVTSPTSVRLNWTDVGDNSKFFSVCYVDTSIGNHCKQGTIIKSEYNYMEIKKLKANTTYLFQVRGHSTSTNFGPYTRPIKVTTPADVPSPVIALEYKVLDKTSVCLRWQTPLEKNGQLKSYIVSYTPDKNRPLDQWLEFKLDVDRKQKTCWPGNADHFTALLDHLDNDRTYTVFVRAVSNVGTGRPAMPIDISTSIDFAGNSRNKSAEDDVKNYHQRVGVIIGIILALIFIIFSIVCVLMRRRCVKRRAMEVANDRMAASINYYPAVAHYATHGSTVQVRLDSTCATDLHETERLVAADSTPAAGGNVTVPEGHLDTKGGLGPLPNGHANGSLKPLLNGSTPNGHVHITENPQYYAFETTPSSRSQPIGYEEDSNSNVKSTSKLYDLQRLFESSKKDNHHECSPHFDAISSANNTGNRKNSCADDFDTSLNSSQLTTSTCLDSSLDQSSQRRAVSPILGPNG